MQTLWRVFIRILGDDFFTAPGNETRDLEMHEPLVGLTDQIHLNPAGFSIVDCAVPPSIQIEICAQFAIDARSKFKLNSAVTPALSL